MLAQSKGIHWGTGASPTGLEGANDPILQYLDPKSTTIINEPEAQWHYAAIKAVRPNGLNIWRASPAIKPADVDWDAHIFSRHIFKGIDHHFVGTQQYPTDILLLNELNLNYERGDNDSDIDPSKWPALYQKLSNFLNDLLEYCKERAQSRNFAPKWWFQGWAPGHGHQEHQSWVGVAQKYDGIVFHAYTTPTEIETEYMLYRQKFPYHPLVLGEWNSINYDGNRVERERLLLNTIDQLCAYDPKLSACYFIWRWAEDNRHEHDIEGNAQRLEMWQNMANPTTAELKTYARDLCTQKALDWSIYEKQIQQESGWRHYDNQGNVLTSPGGAKGVGQIVPSSHPTANWSDPFANLDYSTSLMQSHLQKFGSYKNALAAYNWGPGNVGGYTDTSGRVHPAWDGTRTWRCPHQGIVTWCSVTQMHQYLDKILGPEWSDVVTSPNPFSVGPGLLALMQQHKDRPASDELYFKNDKLENQYSEAFGASGARYVYIFSLNQSFRFPAD